MSHTTVVNNARGLETGSGTDSGTSLYEVKNVLLADNNGKDCSGGTSARNTITSLGHNLSSDDSCPMFVETGDLQNTDPLILTLNDNGALTQTHALLPSSPAIDIVAELDCTDISGISVTTDQRGEIRPFGEGCDSGAYEFGGGTDPGGPVLVGLGEEVVTPETGGAVAASQGDIVEGQVQIPANALASAALIRVEAFQADDPALSPIPDNQGTVNALSRAFRFLPAGQQFLQPVLIVIQYTDEEIESNELIEATVAPLLLVGDAWVEVGPCLTDDPLDPDPCLFSRNAVGNNLIVKTTHFSTYGFSGLVLSDTLTVDSEIDSVDATPGDGICADASGLCTLRAAIMEANANVNVFNIDLPAGTYTLTIDGSGEDAAAMGDLDVTSELTVIGAGRDATIIDGNQDTVNDHIINVRTGASLTLADLTVTNGDQDGIHNQGGTLVLDDVVVSNNDEDGIENNRSGATASLNLKNSTIRNNRSVGIRVRSTGGFSGATIVGSTIRNNSSYGIYISNSNSTSQANVINSTISGNGSYAIVTAPSNSGQSRAFLSHTTVANNNSSGLRTGSASDGGSSSYTLKNTILANNGSDNCSGGTSAPHTITSLGHNISSDAGCPMFTEPGDMQDTDPLLGPLQDNGGPTLTHALLISSPAIDAVAFSDCLETGGNLIETDQRGFDRETGGGCDIGAYEFNAEFKLPDVPSMTQWGLGLLAAVFGVIVVVRKRQSKVGLN